jgi:hypothetical protein
VRHSPSVTPSKALAKACYTRRATFSLSLPRNPTNLTTLTEKPIAMRTTYRRCGQVGSANLTTQPTSDPLVRLREEVGQVTENYGTEVSEGARTSSGERERFIV